MSLLEQIAARTRAVPVFTSPAGQTFSGTSETVAEYGDYLATSNDVYAVAWARAKMVAKLPWVAYKPDGSQYETHPILDLLNKPNPFFTGLKFKTHLELCMSIWGEAYVTVERSGRGKPAELWPIKPTLMTPVTHPTDFISGYLFHPPSGAAPVPFAADEVIWVAYPNPNDWYAALPPMGAARLAADIASAAQKANRNMFVQGMLGGGFVFPPENQTFTKEQADDLENRMDVRFRGVDKAHRWAVMQHEFQLKGMSITPKDAEFIQGLNVAFRQVCRAIGMPPSLVGDSEFATLANLRVYERLFWEQTGEYESDFLAAEFTRQLAPSFANVASVGLDLSDVVALQEDEDSKWAREKDQITGGALTINEWRQDNGLDEVDWGDVWWAPATLLPVSSEQSDWTDQTGTLGYTASDLNRLAVRTRAYERPINRFVEELQGFFDRQRDDILRHVKAGEIETPFDVEVWDRKAEEVAFPRILGIMESAFDQALAEIPERGLRAKTELRRKATLQAGVLAGEMNTTTFKELRLALRRILDEGGDAEAMAAEVDRIMAKARRTRARLIAESEATGAVTDGQLEAWGIEGLTIHVRWVTANDERVRPSHASLNGTSVRVGDSFDIGGCTGVGPGRSGCPSEDCNCRCVLSPVLAEPAPRTDVRRTHVPPTDDESAMLRAMKEAL